MSPSATAAVFPLVPTRSFDEPLTYELPAELAATVAVGSTVEIPLGNAPRVGVVAALDVERPPGVTLKSINRVLDTPLLPPQLIELASWLAEQYGCGRTLALSLVVHPRLATQARATAVPHRQRQQAVRRVVDEVEGIDLTRRQRDIATRVSQAWTSVSHEVDRLGTTRATLAKLADAGVVTIEQRFLDELDPAAGDDGGPSIVDPSDVDAGADGPLVELTEAQLAAVAACLSAPDSEPATMLMGVTGSGKTEVYLEVIDDALQRGDGAIVLVPEISLTPQTARRFIRRFGATVEVLHSGMTRPQRGEAWERIASGESRLVVGPRSAIFAPMHRLGVIVIDEEHDSSYKQDSEPRYDARRVAWRRAQLQSAILIYGSATPRPETFHGISRHVRMTERPGGGRLAPVKLVDVRDFDDELPLTTPVLDAIDACLRRGRKAIILQNRRGYATALHCRSCGTTVRCPRCDVSLVVHGRRHSRQRLACHHCGHAARLSDSCAACGERDIVQLGAGTERVESLLAESFDVELFRLDADTARSRGGVSEILEEFAAAGPSLLIGTQMVAKGHDFPDVELAVVVDADAALAIPDFRAEERAFSLVAQLAGRAGRSAATAEHAAVVVQTHDPSQPFLAHAVEHDVDGFLAAELGRRRELAYPPFSRLVRVLVSSRSQGLTETWVRAVADGVRKLQAGRVLGPADLLRLNDRERAQVLVKTTSPAPVASAVRRFLGRTEAERRRLGVRIVLDVDPQSLL